MTGPALARLLASTRTSEHGAQLYRDAYEAGREDAARTRGSDHRYRQAVVDAIEEWEHYAEQHHDIGREAFEAGNAEDVVQQATYSAMYDRAARRARAILARLPPSAGDGDPC